MPHRGGPTGDPMTTGGNADALGMLTPETMIDALTAWLPSKRWFPAKGSEVIVDLVDSHVLPGPDPATVLIQIVRVSAADPDAEGAPSTVVLQIPLVLDPVEAAAPVRGQTPEPDGLIATVAGGRLIDGPYHPAFVAAWLQHAHWAGGAPTIAEPYDLTGLHVLTGEQSNTSVVLPAVAGGSMLKVLRALAPGDNPDIVVPLALAADGWAGVPTPYAWTELTITDPGNADATAPASWMAHSGVLAELVTQARDGFELACDMAREGEPFTHHARELGTQVAQMHSALRRAFTTDVHDANLDSLVRSMHHRVHTAATASAAVRSRLPKIEAFLAQVLALADTATTHGRPLPPIQRIHGDLHLGQALYSPQTGWRILDFEGEPLRPLVERTRPDLGERDVAGMLRSFDYAAAVGGATSSEWVRSARSAFLNGYTGFLSVPGVLGFGQPPSLADRVVLRDAFELDKALYEVVYEEGNRPDWISIPLHAVDRILASVQAPPI